MPGKPIQSSECIQIPTFNRINQAFEHINDTLQRLDGHGERTAIALETLAAQSVITANHEKRLNVHDEHIELLFERTRSIELKAAEYGGAAAIKNRDTAFWEGVKVALAPYLLAIILLGIYIVDKFGIAEKLARLWKEMKG